MSSVGVQLNKFHDASGRITVSVFGLQGGTEQEIWLADDDNPGVLVGDGDMIAIGGGGVASDGFENTLAKGGPGALLTASYPDVKNMNGWIVGARDHEIPQSYRLFCYVIGLKIAGMTRQQLLDSVVVQVSDSGQGNHPEAEAGVPDDSFVLVGGGFKIDQGALNLATASFPTPSLTWKARSQDHQIASPANIRAYAICLRRNLPVGQLKQPSIKQSDGFQTGHPQAVCNVEPGFALTGGGAEVPQVNNGNFLWKLQPATEISPNFTAASKDHIVSAPCPIVTYALGIQLG